MATVWQKAYRGTAPTKSGWRVQSVTALERGSFGDKPSDEPLASAGIVEVVVDLGRDGKLIATYHRDRDFISSAKGIVTGTNRDKILQAIAKAAKAEAKASRVVGQAKAHHATKKSPGRELNVLGFTKSGKPVMALTREAPSFHPQRRNPKLKAMFPGWSKADHIEAATLLEEHGAKNPRSPSMRWATVHWDLALKTDPGWRPG